MGDSNPTIDRLYEVIASRRRADHRESYTAKLFAQGRAKIVRKFGEEAIEVCVAALSEGHDEVVAESGDLLYHLLVLWVDQGITPDQVWAELESRFGTSGIVERESRTATPTPED